MNELKNIFRAIWIMLLVAIPLMFVWHLELTCDCYVYTLRNGFQEFKALEVYHTLMYLLFGVNSITAIYLITTGDWK